MSSPQSISSTKSSKKRLASHRSNHSSSEPKSIEKKQILPISKQQIDTRDVQSSDKESLLSPHVSESSDNSDHTIEKEKVVEKPEKSSLKNQTNDCVVLKITNFITLQVVFDCLFEKSSTTTIVEMPRRLLVENIKLKYSMGSFKKDEQIIRSIISFNMLDATNSEITVWVFDGKTHENFKIRAQGEFIVEKMPGELHDNVSTTSQWKSNKISRRKYKKACKYPSEIIRVVSKIRKDGKYSYICETDHGEMEFTYSQMYYRFRDVLEKYDNEHLKK